MPQKGKSKYFRLTTIFGVVVGLHLLMWLALGQKQNRFNSSLVDGKVKRTNVQWIFLGSTDQLRPQTIAQLPSKDSKPKTLPAGSSRPSKKNVIARSDRKITKVTSQKDSGTNENVNSQATPAQNSISDSSSTALPSVEDMKKSAVRAAQDFQPRRQLESIETLSQTEKFGREVEKGRRKNCQTSHAHLGLLAIPFLMKDTLTDTGCKW